MDSSKAKRRGSGDPVQDRPPATAPEKRGNGFSQKLRAPVQFFLQALL
ncbi:hypothetical protein [Massilia agri]|jgi:hypothetical protein|uniref:Uncharacterized protein n=1 Tax=Massilia agri TaxID=1886785 RepID=A0ABT2AS97_9BURK|nr:hypothetical protein [Massilia agri]MCS0599129.1 hypothetical protein [Massilia agri]